MASLMDPTDAAQAARGDRSGLDYDFLRYMGVRPEVQREIQEFYLPHFTARHKVLDLGCGDGDFVRMLVEQGIEVTGVDSDDKAFVAAEDNGLPIVQDDVFRFLRSLSPNTVDGIFCAHLVEHLAYDDVIELIGLSFEALMPGGVIVLATPDVRSLFSHLEMFYLHFGHISFYHPRLLCFFLEHAGFEHAEYGTNPRTASPLLGELNQLQVNTSARDVTFGHEIPPQGASFLHRASYSLKRRLARWLVQPFLDELTISVNREIEVARSDLRTLAAAMQSLNGPFECFALAYKPDPTSSSSTRLPISK